MLTIPQPSFHMGVYAITHVASGKRYIGSTSNFSVRWRAHYYDCQAGRHGNQRLQNAWSKYGSTAFVFSVLDYVDDAAELLRTEQQWIDAARPAYNLRSRVLPTPRGADQRRSSVTDALVIELRQRAAQGEGTAALAREFGLHQGHVSRVVSGRTWSHIQAVPAVLLNPGNQKLNAEQVRQIRLLFATGVAGPQLARTYGISHALVRKIVSGKVWTHLALVPPQKRGGRRLARLTATQVLAIQQRRAAGESYAAIARDYGIASITAQRAVKGRSPKC